jgi:MFS family permease
VVAALCRMPYRKKRIVHPTISRKLLRPEAVTTFFTIPLGMLGDRVDRKRLLMWMFVFMTALTFLLAFTRNFAEAMIIYGLAGIPTAASLVVGYAFFLDLVPEKRIEEFVGINMITWAAPQAVSPLIGGYLIDTWGYRSMFPAAAGFMVIGLIIFPFIQVASPQIDIKK